MNQFGLGHQKVVRSQFRISRLVVVLLSATLLACSSPEEKVAAFYQKGMAHLEKGDLVKARLDFANALQINKNMVPALYGMAQIFERQGEWEKTYAFLNKVVEVDANHYEAQLKLGRLLLAAGHLDRAMATVETLIKLQAESPDALALKAAVLYRLDNRRAAVEHAKAALDRMPGNVDALVVLATERLTAGDPAAAIRIVDAGGAKGEPGIPLQMIKIQALEKLNQLDAAEAIYRQLIAAYPEQKDYRRSLVQFLINHKAMGRAEQEIRALAQLNPKDSQGNLDLIGFLEKVKGPDVALAEAQALIKAHPDLPEYQFILAQLQTTQGAYGAAEQIYQSILAKGKEDAPEHVRAKGLMAALRLQQGDRAGVEKLVQEILAKDARNEQALLLKAGISADQGRYEDAIADLRTILRDVPNSARAHLQSARVHELNGSRDLADDHYARAFQATKASPQFGIPYAEFLLRQRRAKQAEAVLQETLRAYPNDIPSLRVLSQVYLMSGNMVGAQGIADHVAKLSESGGVASQIQGAVYSAQRNFEGSIASFRRAYDSSPAEVQPMLALVRSYLGAGKTKEALAFVNSVVASNPNNLEAKLLQGELLNSTGARDQALSVIEGVVQKDPKRVQAYQSLAIVLNDLKKPEEALSRVQAGLKATNQDFSLRLVEVGLVEASGKIDEAARLYEGLLKDRPGAEVVANNLVSLLTDHREDPASLKRAYELSQKIRTTDIPIMKDTVGWAAYKVGKYHEAAPLLESAARDLPDMAVIHYHLGMNHLALGNKKAARKSLEQSVQIAKAQPFAQLDQAKRALADL